MEAAISYQCPDCAVARGQQLPDAGDAAPGAAFSRWLSRSSFVDRDAAEPPASGEGDAGDPPASSEGDAGEPTTSGEGDAGEPSSSGDPGGTDGGQLPTPVGAKATAAGAGAAMLGGLLLGPILGGGTFFLVSAGVIGWGVARLVLLAGEERRSPYLRALAMTASGFTVAIGLAVAGAGALPPGLLALAYPAAVYGGWIVVRSR